MGQDTIRTADIIDAQVTLAKLADIATDRLIGRDTAGAGVPEALTVGGGVEFSGSGGIQRSALSGDVTAAAGSASVTVDQARGLRETGGPTTLTMASIADGEVLYRSGSTIDGRATSSTTTYDTAGTYSLAIPSWATSVRFRLQGGGGGGAAGGRRGAGSATQGGGGGNSGFYCEWECDVAALTGPLEVIVGVGGTGAPGIAADGDATATGGSAGGDTSIRNNAGAGDVVCVAQGGALATGVAAASVSLASEEGWLSNRGGAGSSTGAANGGTGVATSLTKAPGSGGGGGGVSTGNVPSNGGRGGKGALGLDFDGATNGQLGGTAPNNPGVDATASAGRRGSGGPGGGAGGAGDGSANGGRGGDGIRGTGGGGGGGARGAATSGRGGNGGAGWALISFT